MRPTAANTAREDRVGVSAESPEDLPPFRPFCEQTYRRSWQAGGSHVAGEGLLDGGEVGAAEVVHVHQERIELVERDPVFGSGR